MNLKFRYSLIFSLLFLTAFIFAVNPSFAAVDNVYVSTTGNDGWNGQSATYNATTGDGPKATITSAINTVANNGTVYIASGTYHENLNVYIKNVNLVGEDPDTTIIDGQQKAGVLYFAGFDTYKYYTLVINGLTLTNGKIDRGGGILNDQGTVYLLNTKIINNIATVAGGGLYNLGTTYADSLTEISGNIKQGSMMNDTDNVYGNPVVPLPSAIENPLPGEEQDGTDDPTTTDNPTTTDDTKTTANAAQETNTTNSGTVPLPSTGAPLAALAFAVGLLSLGTLKGFKR